MRIARLVAAHVVVGLVTAALALGLADIVLDRMTISARAFPFVVVLFTAIRLVVRLIMRATIVLASLAGLVASFASLLITDIVSSGFRISGLTTWVVATLIVWLGGLVAELVVGVGLRRRLRGAS